MSNWHHKKKAWLKVAQNSPTARCHWCKRELTFRRATFDHEPPIAEGGGGGRGVIACYDCNNHRGRITSAKVSGKVSHAKDKPLPPRSLFSKPGRNRRAKRFDHTAERAENVSAWNKISRMGIRPPWDAAVKASKQ